MPEMSPFEQGFCRSAPWRWFARTVALPWALQDQQLSGDVLEIGGGIDAPAYQQMIARIERRIAALPLYR